VGEFEEPEFRDKFLSGALHPDCYYWHEGMADWSPISDYRAVAKTQKISFTPPVSPTVRIVMDQPASGTASPRPIATRFLLKLKNLFSSGKKPRTQR
jgi:GYF domain 2